MKAVFLIITIVAFLPESVPAQRVFELTPGETPFIEDSYIAPFPIDGLSPEKEVLFEAKIAPTYVLWAYFPSVKNPESTGFFADVSITPAIRFKLYSEKSHPVRRPSYLPKVTIQTAFRGSSVQVYPFVMFQHHSNGQSGETLLGEEQGDESGRSARINTETGSFATNLVRAGGFLHTGRLRRHYFGASYELHPVKGGFSIDPGIAGLYGRKRLSGMHTWYDAGIRFRVDLKYTRLLDKPTGISPDIFEGTVRWRFSRTNPVGVFARYYQGQDYDNISFRKELKQVQFGLSYENPVVDLYERFFDE